MFDHLDQEPWLWTPADRKVAADIAGYWVNFARSGDPNGPGLPVWPRFAAIGGAVLRLDDPVAVGPPPELATLQIFDGVYAKIRGAPFGSASPP